MVDETRIFVEFAKELLLILKDEWPFEGLGHETPHFAADGSALTHGRIPGGAMQAGDRRRSAFRGGFQREKPRHLVLGDVERRRQAEEFWRSRVGEAEGEKKGDDEMERKGDDADDDDDEEMQTPIQAGSE